MPKEPIQFFLHICDEIRYILSVITVDMTKEDFRADDTLKRAVVRSLEIIGEATKKIPADEKVRWHTVKMKTNIYRKYQKTQLKYHLCKWVAV